MKVIDVAEHYAPSGGGVKTYVNNKIDAAQANGVQMIILAPGQEDKIEYRNGAKIYWVKGPRLMVDKKYGVFRNERAVHQILDQEQADIVEGGSVWRGGEMVSNWSGKAKKMWIFHQDFVAAYGHSLFDRFINRDQIDRLFYPFWSKLRRVSQGYDSTVVAGAWLGKRLESFNIKNPVVVPFGIDKEFFSVRNRNEEARRSLLEQCGRTEDVPLLITVSRFHPEKRLRCLFEAVNIVNKTQPVAHIVFGEGFLLNRHRRYAENSPGIRLAGFTSNREELAQALASSDLLLHGSAAETFGLGVAEGLCSGLPVVGPSIGGASDLIDDRYGVSYEPGNAQACADAIQSALSKNRREWAPIIKEQSEHIQSTQGHFEQLFSYYESVLVGNQLAVEH